MNNTSISIALCTYQGERFLQAQLDSLAHQTHLPSELVVVDDGSKDGTLTMLRNFQSSAPFPVRIFQNDVNLHFTGNFLKAASLCEGDYIAFCDQDDIWSPEKLISVVDVIRKDQSDLIVHEGMVIDADGVPSGKLTPCFSDPERTAAEWPLGMGKGFAMVVSRSVISEIMEMWSWDTYLIFRNKYGAPLGHDLLVYSWCQDRNRSIIRKPLVRYRVHEGNVTASAHEVKSWARRLSVYLERIQIRNFNYSNHATKWAAEAEFINTQFQHRGGPGILALRQYLEKKADLWRARAIINESHRFQDYFYGLISLRRQNRAAPSYLQFGVLSITKDVIIGGFSVLSRRIFVPR